MSSVWRPLGRIFLVIALTADLFGAASICDVYGFAPQAGLAADSPLAALGQICTSNAEDPEPSQTPEPKDCCDHCLLGFSALAWGWPDQPALAWPVRLLADSPRLEGPGHVSPIRGAQAPSRAPPAA